MVQNELVTSKHLQGYIYIRPQYCFTDYFGLRNMKLRIYKLLFIVYKLHIKLC